MALAPFVLATVAATDCGSQLVGFSAKPGRSTLTAIERIRSGTPSRICGIGSERIVTWAVSGSRYRAALTTMSPRSKGPATAGVIIAIESGAPL